MAFGHGVYHNNRKQTRASRLAFNLLILWLPPSQCLEYRHTTTPDLRADFCYYNMASLSNARLPRLVSFFVHLTQNQSLGKWSLSLGIASIRVTYEHVCGISSRLLIDVGGLAHCEWAYL